MTVKETYVHAQGEPPLTNEEKGAIALAEHANLPWVTAPEALRDAYRVFSRIVLAAVKEAKP